MLNVKEYPVMNKFCLLIFISFSALSIKAADWIVISKQEYELDFAKAKSFYAGAKYSYTITYKSFFGHKAEVPYETDHGFYIKDGKSSYTNLPGQLTIQDEGVRCVVDSTEKTLVLSEPDYTYDWSVDEMVYETTISYAKIERMIGPKGKKFRISYPEEFPYEKTEIELNSDGLISAITTFYREFVPLQPEVENSPKEQVKFRIEISDYNTNVVLSLSQKMSYYIQKSGKSYTPAAAFAGFQIKDTRIKK